MASLSNPPHISSSPHNSDIRSWPVRKVRWVTWSRQGEKREAGLLQFCVFYSRWDAFKYVFMVSPVPTGHNYKDIQTFSPHHKEQLWNEKTKDLVLTAVFWRFGIFQVAPKSECEFSSCFMEVKLTSSSLPFIKFKMLCNSPLTTDPLFKVGNLPKITLFQVKT